MDKRKGKIEYFLHYDLNDVYSHLGEVKEVIDNVKVSKNLASVTT